MNDAHALTVENLLRVFPEAMRNDESIVALARSIATALVEREKELRGLTIYTRIDELPEDLLDILARDFKVDWYDPDYDLGQKRQTLKDSWHVHRILGTKAAVETAIRAIYPDAEVREWFEYGGLPYHFKLLIDASYERVDQARHRRVLERVGYYKPLRSVLDEIEYRDAGATATAYAVTACVGCEITDGAVAVRY